MTRGDEMAHRSGDVDNEVQRASVEDKSKNIDELNEWRRGKVDPMLDKFNKILLEGDGPDNPSLITLVALILQKFDLILDTVRWTGKALVALAGLIVALISINTVWGPSIRHYFGLPTSYVTAPPSGVSYSQPGPQNAGGPETPNH